MSPLHWRRICISKYFVEEAAPGRAAAGAQGKDRVAAGAVATKRALVQAATAFAPSAGTKSHTWPANAALTRFVPSAGRR